MSPSADPAAEPPGSRPVGGTRTTLGPQVLSERASAPNYGFGTSTRDQMEKVFVSQEHAALVASSCSPGPVYDDIPAIGPQSNGRLISAPRFGFGTSNRDHMAKVYISSDHDKYSGGRDAPGPGNYPVASLVGKVNSTKSTEPRYGMGSSTREHMSKVFISNEHNTTNDYGKEGPGPIYNPTLNQRSYGVGNQVLSSGPSPYSAGGIDGVRNGSQPSWVLGKAERFEKDGAAWVPGPGTYPIRPAVGPQSNGRLASAPLYSFGASSREVANKVFISHEHGKVTGGRDAPGPGNYAVPSLTGKPVVAGLQRSGAKWGFGTSQRFSDTFKERAPGPGHYVI